MCIEMYLCGPIHMTTFQNVHIYLTYIALHVHLPRTAFET